MCPRDPEQKKKEPPRFVDCTSIAQSTAEFKMTSVADYDFQIPPERIAQRPRPFGEHKLLVYRRGSTPETSSIEHSSFEALTSILCAGDLLILNDTKVVPAQVLCVLVCSSFCPQIQ